MTNNTNSNDSISKTAEKRSILKGFSSAISLLTIYPSGTKSVLDYSAKDAVMFFPLVGLLSALPGYFVVKYLSHLGVHSLASAAVYLAVSELITRFMHMDGLADVGDAIGASKDKARRLEVMSDSSIGAFGAVSIALALILKFAFIYVVIALSYYEILIVAAALARMAAVFSAYLGSPAKNEGLGVSVCSKPGVIEIMTIAVQLAGIALIAFFGFGSAFIPLAISGLVAMVIPHLISEQFGGVTGDVMGASIAISEILILFIFISEVNWWI